MRAYVDVKAFSEALNNVSRVLQRSRIPVLEGLLVQFEGGLCTLIGTDMTTWLSVRLPARGDDFAFVLQKPQAAVKACRYFDGELTLEPRGDEAEPLKATFICGKRAVKFSITVDRFISRIYQSGDREERGIKALSLDQGR